MNNYENKEDYFFIYIITCLLILCIVCTCCNYFNIKKKERNFNIVYLDFFYENNDFNNNLIPNILII